MKPSPTALERYLIHPQELSLPLDPKTVFGREAPLRVEVGFGGGEYLVWWAQQHPECNFFGIEQPADCIFRAARLLENAGVENVRLIRGDARYLLRELFAPGSLEHVLMQFPMPWPKDKHAKHRVSSPDFAHTLADVLQPKAVFELVTDQDWYAFEADRFFEANPSFSKEVLQEDPERPFRTRYESKWLEEGRSIYRLLVQLQEPKAAPRLIPSEEMDTYALNSGFDADALQALKGRRFKQGDSVAEIKEILQAEDGWVLRTVASDSSFSQMFHLRIRNKADGRCLLKVDQVPRPYYTDAVRFSLVAVREALDVASTLAGDK
ncbi:MAG: tRNA (guanosine(46)-N7)-methyltransferase TrmB [Planctomycetota bacterium]